MTIEDIKAGMELYYVYKNSSQKVNDTPYKINIEVKQVRDEYIICFNPKHKTTIRFDKQNLHQVIKQKERIGVYQEGRAYFSKEHYEHCLKINSLKKEIKQYLPNDLKSLNQIIEIINNSHKNKTNEKYNYLEEI